MSSGWVDQAKPLALEIHPVEELGQVESEPAGEVAVGLAAVPAGRKVCLSAGAIAGPLARLLGVAGRFPASRRAVAAEARFRAVASAGPAPVRPSQRDESRRFDRQGNQPMRSMPP